jgi:hypothetical protein
MLKGKLMQKVGIITQKAATRLVYYEEGDRIPTVGEFSNEIGASQGTMQAALSLLQEEKAVTLLSKGHLGTFITAIDRIKLLEIAGLKTIVGVMPLPYSKKYEGLATGIFVVLEENGLDVALAFMRGSNNRLRGLEEGRYDFAVMSQLTAQYYIDAGENIRIIKTFGGYSYVGKHVLLMRDDSSGNMDNFDNCKVGIDNSSVDQKTLTMNYFANKNVEYVPLVYSQIISYLRSGIIDAAIWNLDDIDLAGNHLHYRSLEDKNLDIGDTEAAVVCLTDNSLVYEVLKRMLDIDKVLEFQKNVLADKIMPRY